MTNHDISKRMGTCLHSLSALESINYKTGPKPYPKYPRMSMYLWTLLLLALPCFLLLRKASTRVKHKLPPGPRTLPLIGNLLEIRVNNTAFHELLRRSWLQFGPIFTLWSGISPFVVITDGEMAYEALVKQGTVFAGRPKSSGFRKQLTADNHTITAALHHHLWRTLRTSLVSGVLSNNSVTKFRVVRERAMNKLLRGLQDEAEISQGVVSPREHIRTMLFHVIFCMCFGVEPDEDSLETVKEAIWFGQSTLLVFDDSLISPLLPWLRKNAAVQSAMERNALLPHINAAKQQHSKVCDSGIIKDAYIFSLLDLRIEGSGNKPRALSDNELIALCTEFMAAATDTTATLLEWALARIAMDNRVHKKLWEELSKNELEITEEEAKRMPYLQAVVKETMRRHPSAYLMVPRTVDKDVKIGGYDIPAGCRISFYGYAMGMDSRFWKLAEEFWPERFLEGGEGKEVDVIGGKEIRMLPFGAGRRACPGIGLGMMHFSFILGRLVRSFSWECVPGKDIDLSVAPLLTVMMKHPLRVLISQRTHSV